MSAPQTSSPHVARILDNIDKDRMLALASDLIRIPSFKGQETDAARFLANFFQERGYTVQLQEVEPGRFPDYRHSEGFRRRQGPSCLTVT